MNRIIRSFVCVLCLTFATAAFASDWVDIGKVASEAGHVMTSWGPIEPATNGGSWGGIDDCRAIWTPSDGTVSATITMTFATGDACIHVYHLSGLADDSFDVFLDGFFVGHYADAAGGAEFWLWTSFPVAATPGVHVVEFVATGPAWPSWGTWGQVGISEVGVAPCTVSEDEQTWGTMKSFYR